MYMYAAQSDGVTLLYTYIDVDMTLNHHVHTRTCMYIHTLHTCIYIYMISTCTVEKVRPQWQELQHSPSPYQYFHYLLSTVAALLGAYCTCCGLSPSLSTCCDSVRSEGCGVMMSSSCGPTPCCWKSGCGSGSGRSLRSGTCAWKRRRRRQMWNVTCAFDNLLFWACRE